MTKVQEARLKSITFNIENPSQSDHVSDYQKEVRIKFVTFFMENFKKFNDHKYSTTWLSLVDKIRRKEEWEKISCYMELLFRNNFRSIYHICDYFHIDYENILKLILDKKLHQSTLWRIESILGLSTQTRKHHKEKTYVRYEKEEVSDQQKTVENSFKDFLSRNYSDREFDLYEMDILQHVSKSINICRETVLKLFDGAFICSKSLNKISIWLASIEQNKGEQE